MMVRLINDDRQTSNSLETNITVRINGERVEVNADPMTRLNVLLRENLGQTGTKTGCDAGDCGACSVLVDGEIVCSCMVPSGRMNGAEIITVEGLGRCDTTARLQRAFHHYGAAQCGICTPGMLLSASALLAKSPYPTTREVEDALGGVLCRCTGYRKIVRAVRDAHLFDAQSNVERVDSAVGERIPRLDGAEKILGREKFGDDNAPQNSLLLRVIRSPYHHARFEFGDLKAFLASNPGIDCVLTARDIPGENKFGVIPPFRDQPVFAESVARYQGEAVAAIVGDLQTIENFNLDDFPISFTQLDAALSVNEAQHENAPRLHVDRVGNELTTGLVQHGNVEDAIAESAVQVSGKFSTGFVEHAYIEPEAGFARRVGDRLEVFGCTQAPYMDREELARILGLPEHDIRILPSAVGGGFGSKLDLSFQPFVALAAWRLNRPVRITYTRPESMLSTTKRHPSEIVARIGASHDGQITAMDFYGEFNTGAYASWGPTVANRVPVHASGPYRIPAYRARSKAVHTHSAPAGAFRGFGVPQSAIAQEALFDEMADRLQIDRLDFRIINAVRDGDATVTGQTFSQGVGITQCLATLQLRWTQLNDEIARFNAAAIEHEAQHELAVKLRRGIGVASCWYGCGNTSLPNPSTIKVGLSREGKAVLFQGAVDIGQGSNTVIAQICAEALGLGLENFEIVSADTDRTADAGKTSASRQTFVSGKAAELAGIDLRSKILASLHITEPCKLVLQDNRLSADGVDAAIDLATLPADDEGLVMVGEGTFDPPTSPLDENGQGEPYATFGYGAQLAVTEVDLDLGTVKVLEIVAAHDVGRVINPTLAEGQIEGGIAQGLGMALMEEFIPGKTDNLHDYLIPTFGDIPDIDIKLVEDADAIGPFGAKGLGEHVLIPTAPAILNAIRHATGATIRRVPATPDRVLAAIKELQ